MAVLPGLAVLRRYERSWLAPDVLAGLTVAAMLVPQAMAYAELAGLPPETGFRAALVALVAYALVGSSRHLGVGPEPGTAVLAATGVAPLAAGDAGRYAVLMAALALLVAAVCAVAAALRLGFVASLLSRPVLVGYLAGVGLTLVTSQLGKLTGALVEGDSPLARLVDLAGRAGDVELDALLLGGGTLTAILLLRWRVPRVPAALLAVLAATVVSAVADLQVDLVGAVPQALPTLDVPDVGVADVRALVPVALGLALVGYADNVLTGRAIAGRMGYRIDANQELVALGVVNAVAGVAQGFPVSSSASRSAVPASLGSKTQLAGLVAAGALAVTLVLGRGALAEFPQPAIAAVVLAAAVAIIDIPAFRDLLRLHRSEAALAVAATLGVLAFDVLVGVAVAVGLSVLVAVGRMARPHDAVLGAGPGVDGWVDVEDGARPLPGLLVYRFDAPLFFANAGWFRQRLHEQLEAHPGEEEWVVLDFEGVGSVDATAVDELRDVCAELARAGVQVIGVARANHAALGVLRRAGLVGADGPITVFPTINAAVRAFAAAAAPG